MNRLAPSILSADFWKLGEQIGLLEKSGVDMLHIDVMDGSFVPSLSFGLPVVKTIREKTAMFFDCHLMIEKPERYIEAFANAGADSITVHYEACDDLKTVLKSIKSLGKRAGVSINPATPVSVLEDVLHEADMFLLMTVNPGFGGQKLIPEVLSKVSELKGLLESKGLNTDIEVDGGINLSTLPLVLEAGANVIVSGNSIFLGDIEENIKSFKHIMGD